MKKWFKDILGVDDRKKDKFDDIGALTLEESKKRCKRIKATHKEIREARKVVKYICKDCGYHTSVFRRCHVCGGNLRYNQLYERILENRKLEKKSEAKRDALHN